jgi:ribosomal protein L11 methyltransferase
MVRAEEARALMVELFPHGFEEIEHADGLELVAYTDARGEERIWQAFGAATSADIADGWEERWREFHRPVRVGEIWIGQPWQTPPPDAPTVVVIDPGRAFGTGAHPTTRLALQLLSELDRGSVLDVGCGSGVVAIAAAKLGFAPVRAVDADPAAVEATRRNAATNSVEVEVTAADAATSSLPDADVVIANITRELVRALAGRISCRNYIASGYLMTEPTSLPGFRHVRRETEDGWAADLFASQ